MAKSPLSTLHVKRHGNKCFTTEVLTSVHISCYTFTYLAICAVFQVGLEQKFLD